jgi:hypothetical protein
LRGPAIAHWLYPPGIERQYIDVDLLVPVVRFDDAEAVLRGLGFARSPLEPELRGDRPRYAHTWVDGRTRVMVDLHRTLAGVRGAPARLWEEISQATESLRVARSRMEMPGPAGRTLVVGLNAAQHGRRDPRSLTDLRLALVVAPATTWAEAAAMARRVEAEEAFSAGLRLVPEGAGLADELGLTARRSVATQLRTQSAPEAALAFDWFVREVGVRDGIRIAARKAVPSVAFICAWSPLARKGRIGLAAAYVWRPLWLLGQSVVALRAWMRARRVTLRGAMEAEDP